MTQLRTTLTTLWQFYRLPRPIRATLRERSEHRDAASVRHVFDYWREYPFDIAEAVLYVDHKAWLLAFYRREYPELFELPEFIVDRDAVEAAEDRFARGAIDAEMCDFLIEVARELR